MKTEKTVCDECGRTKGESNHWHQMGLYTQPQPSNNRVTILLGVLDVADFDRTWKFEIHDLCGEQCFYKHIGKLLKLNPVEGE